MRSSPVKQGGVALITAVLIVALVTAAAVAMASKQQFDIRRTANIFNNDKAYQFALGAEDYARNVLQWDISENASLTDHLGEDWATPVSVPVEGAMLSGSVQDLQGRINLNALIKDDGTQNDEMVQRFQRLLRLLGLDENIAQATIDWVDDEGIDPTGSGGVEDDTYMLLNPPYRTPHGMMASASELLLVKGVDKESYQKMAPFVTALPSRDTAINVNTAPAEVLASLANDLDGETLVEQRPEEGFDKIDDFSAQPQLAGKPNYKEAFLDIKSNYFQVDAVAEFDGSTARLHSLLQRNDSGGVWVVMRSRGAY